MRQHSVVVRVVARLLLAPSVVVAGAVIVKSYREVGDGFAAGVVVALAVALQYVALGGTAAEKALPLLRHAPALTLGGLLLALVSGFFPLALGQPPLTHRPLPGNEVISVGTVELFTPLAFDVGIFLLVVGGLAVLLHQFARSDEDETS